MQSHQDIKADPLDELPADVLLEIAARLRPEDAVHFFSASTMFKELFKKHCLGIDSFWQEKLQLHFPGTFKQIKNTKNTDWQAAFIEAYKKHYRKLSLRDKKLFSIVKEGDIESFIAGKYSLNDLTKADINRIHAISWANQNQHQTMLDHFYHQLVLPYFTNTAYSLDLVKRSEHQKLSILHWAVACRQHPDTIDAIIASGMSVDVLTSDHATPLYTAARNGRLDIVKTLIAQGANVDATRSNGETPLFIAAQQGHLDVVKHLIAQGANVDATRSDGATPLYVAAQQGHLDVVKHLIAQGANVDAARSDGATPLYVAAQNGHLDVVETLLAQGANVDAARSDGCTPLWIAAYNGHLGIVEHLIAQGANIHAAKSNGSTPFYIAAQQGHLDVVKHLIAQGANVDAAKSNGVTPFYIAAQQGHLDVVKHLIAQGADVNAASSNGATPLYIAAQNGHLDVVETLIAEDANVNAARSTGETPLYIAAQQGHLDVVKHLIAQGANIHAAKSNGYTPLYVAIENGHREVAKALVIPMLQNYIEARSADTAPEYKRSINVFGLFSIHSGSSKNEKVAAASMLKCVLEGADPANLKEHEKALNHGDLGKFFSVVKSDIERRKKDASSGFRV